VTGRGAEVRGLEVPKSRCPHAPTPLLVPKTPVHYNIGHLAVAEGDTVSPDEA
jgi:hypothetical protein